MQVSLVNNTVARALWLLLSLTYSVCQCIRQHLKPDKSLSNLGVILYTQDKIQTYYPVINTFTKNFSSTSQTSGHNGCKCESIMATCLGMAGIPDCADALESITAYDMFRACVEIGTGDLMIEVSHAHISYNGDSTRLVQSHYYPSNWRPQLSSNSTIDWCVNPYHITMGLQMCGNRLH